MPSKAEMERAQNLAAQLGATCAEAVLAWGESINEYEATPDDHPAKSLRLSLAQAHGVEVMKLGKKLAAKMRPTKG